MAFKLTSGHACLIFGTIDSTNAEARRRVEQGAADPLWIVADVQSRGRGRYGRGWVSVPGNLHATLVLPQRIELKRAGLLSFVAALAVADVVRAYVAPKPVTVKWPNDVLIDGRKVAGILLETCTAERDMTDFLVIGIGLNLVSFPDDTDHPATSIGANISASFPSRNGALDELDASFFRWHGVWLENGFEPVRQAWLAIAAGFGKTLKARLPGAVVEGVFETLAPTGELVLRLPDGKVKLIAAADVFLHERPTQEQAHAVGD